MNIRDTLFGDLPFSQWPSDSSSQRDVEPWASFVRARLQSSANKEEAWQSLLGVLSMPDLESRHYLQAWHFLRSLGFDPPPAEAKKLFGVVVEVAMKEGLDILAAYADQTARYFNYSGAAVIWERPEGSLDTSVDGLLQAGSVLVEVIGPLESPRPASPPPKGHARINLLVPSGLHMGQGPYEALARDPLGGPVIAAAVELMNALIGKAEKRTT